MIDTDHPEFTEFEGETLGDTLTNLITEIMRLREGIKFALSYTRPTPHTDDPWMACREFIVEYLKELIE